MIARLIKPVIVVRQDISYGVETLSAGATVDFDPVEGVTEVVCDGNVYIVMVKDLLKSRSSDRVGTALKRPVTRDGCCTFALRLHLVLTYRDGLFDVLAFGPKLGDHFG